MKTLLVLTLLVALVGLGVWNRPKGEPSALFFQAELSAEHDTEFHLGMDAEGKPEIRRVDETGKLLTIPSVMIDEGMEYQPVKAESVPWMRYLGGRVKTADEIAKQQAEWAGDEYGNVFLPGAEMQHVSTCGDAIPIGENEPENHEMAYSGLWGRSHWVHALSSKSTPDGDRHAY